MNVKEIFYNQSGRLRSGWRFLIFQLFIIFLGAVIVAAADFVLQKLQFGDNNSGLLFFIYRNAVFLLLAILGGWLCGRFLEDLPFRALGCAFTNGWLKHLFAGLMVGAVSISIAVLIAVLFGGMRLEFNQNAGQSAILLTLSVSLVVFVIGAAAEEAYFRGYVLQTFARAHLAWLAIAFTALFFAWAHFNNPSAGWISVTNTALAGVWFGAAYLKTRDLWFPFGIHLIWNWLQGAIFGIPVSGITELTTAPLFQQTEKGSDFLNGGSYGVEGGFSATIALIISMVLIYFLPVLKPSEEMLALTGEEKLREVRTEN
jgi:membrane protease YdiL (CAAX protease family)